jgi:streptomycin 6-kinase
LNELPQSATGAEWLSRLPSIVAECERRWSLRVGPPFAEPSYNYVAPAVRGDGMPAVLKVCPANREFFTEAEALKLFDGRGAVRLLEAHLEQGALLLERLEPGTPLARLTDDEEVTAIAVQVMRRLWRPVPAGHPFPSVADWAGGLGRLRERFGGGSGPFPAMLVEEAERLFAELIGSAAELRLLHGDLHHGNILAGQRRPWLAIDPKGLVGEPAYETGALLRNPLPRLLAAPRPELILARRVDQLAEELGFDRARLQGWGVAQAVLAAWWALEDHGHGWEPFIACAELLAARRQWHRCYHRRMIELARIFLEKAEENLAAARSEYASHRYNSCASRCYYACFQAAIYALIRAGIRPPSRTGEWGHDFVQAEFNGQLISRRKLYPGHLRDVLQQTYALRVKADYELDHVSEVRAARALRRATEFVETIRGDGAR